MFDRYYQYIQAISSIIEAKAQDIWLVFHSILVDQSQNDLYQLNMEEHLKRNYGMGYKFLFRIGGLVRSYGIIIEKFVQGIDNYYHSQSYLFVMVLDYYLYAISLLLKLDFKI